MTKITSLDLIKVLVNSSADEIGLVTETIVKLNKRNNPLADKKVTKQTCGKFQFGGSFNERLTDALDSSLGVDAMSVGHVETKSLPWGKWFEGAENKVIEHEKEDGTHYYLRYYNATTDLDVTYSVDGNAPTDEDWENIERFKPASKKNTTYVTENAGEIENKTLKTNVVDFKNITSIEIDGVEYEIED